MSPLPMPDPDLYGFQLPGLDAPRVEWEDAFRQLNGVSLTLEQIQRGYNASYVAGCGGGAEGPDRQALRAFCEKEGITPADVAAEAILVRWLPVLDAAFDGIDIFEGVPPYVDVALRKLEVRYDVLEFIGAEPWVGELQA